MMLYKMGITNTLTIIGNSYTGTKHIVIRTIHLCLFWDFRDWNKKINEEFKKYLSPSRAEEDFDTNYIVSKINEYITKKQKEILILSLR